MRLAILFLCLAGCAMQPGHAATPSVAAGGGHSLGLHGDGTLRSWGDDSTGALGLGRSLFSTTPIPVSGLSGVTAIAAGGAHTVALKDNGTVWTWGNNELGQLGDGTVTARSLPVQVAGLTGVTRIAAGRFHTIALKADGTVWSWGGNYVGEQGVEGSHRLVPGLVGGLPPAVAEIAAGWSHTLVRTAEGSVWAWGSNGNGQLGDGTMTELYGGRATPRMVVGLAGVAQISAGIHHSVARKNDGTVWAWGENKNGQVGDGSTTDRSLPVQVSGLASVVEIAAGGQHTLARGSDGSVRAWGDGGYGQIGDGLYLSRLTPILLPELTGVARMSPGFLHSVAVTTDGGLFVWGSNSNGQLGDGSTVSRGIPSRLAGVTGIAASAVGVFHSVALKRDGTVLTWGDNSQGQLGNGVFTFRSSPSVVPGVSGIVEIAAGYAHSLVRTSAGKILVWGDNTYLQLGADTTSISSPMEVAGIADATAIAAGVFHSLVLRGNGTVASFGSNYRGRLGTGNGDGILGLAAVRGLTDVTRIAAGGGHSLAVKSDGTVWSWGENDFGQLGDGTTADRFAPVQVAGLTGVVEVAAGPAHSLARKSDGSVWAWGRNIEGALGDGTAINRSTPVRVNGLPAATKIVAGRDFSIALSGGAVWAWGINYNGGLGCPSCDGRVAPVRIPGLERIASISAGQFHVLALRDDGVVYAWGDGKLGQMGDGTLVDRESPVVVLHEGATGSVAGNDWFLDLDPAVAAAISSDQIPVFLLAATAAGADITAAIRFRAQDVGTAGSVFVFALAPASQVRGGQAASALKMGRAKDGAKADTPIACVLAQLNASGQMVAVTSSNLAAYLTGVLSAQGASVSILNGVPAGNVAGATFFVGYGGSGTAMINTGTNRAAVTLPGSLTCQPSAPQTGWWWNPLEDGRGFSIEKRGNNLFFAAFLYDISGRSTWYVSSGPVSLEGSLYNGELLAASGGQTLGGPYLRFPTLANAGAMTMTFNNESTGTIVWPGGTVPIQRFNIVPNGLTAAPVAGTPESGWWWNEAEAGRGFFMEWQNGTLDIAGYMYDDAGNPVWYLTVGGTSTTNPQSFTGTWWSYTGGQTLTGPWRQNARTNSNVAPLTITFSGPDTALMTLPNGRTTNLKRHRF